MRLLAVLALGMLAAYYVLRAVAARCSGPQCDGYIPLSLLLPLLVLIVDAATGYAAASAAWRRARGSASRADRLRQATWLAFLIGCALVGVLGPVASLTVFRDSPDVFVPVATALAALVPVSVLAYSLLSPAPRGTSPAP